MKKIIGIIVCLLCCGLGLMAQGVSVEVSSLGSYNMFGKTFYITSGMSDMPDNDLEFIHYKNIIHQRLLRIKAIPAENKRDADVRVVLNCSITDGTPSYISGTSVHFPMLYSSMSSAQVEQQYTRVVTLSGMDNKSDLENPPMLWKVNARSDGSSNNLLEIFPYAVEVMGGNIGQPTREMKHYWINMTDIDANAMAAGFYLNPNMIVAPYHGVSKLPNGSVMQYIRGVLLKEDSTDLYLLINKDYNLFSVPRIIELVYNGQVYPASSVYAPLHQMGDVRGKILSEHEECILLQLSFDTAMNKGDTFDLVMYKGKKKKYELFRFSNVILK